MVYDPFGGGGALTLMSATASSLPLREVAPGSPWLLALAIVLATFVHEDLATVVAGMLVADGIASVELALPALYVGMVAGDLGLYGMGKLIARHRAFRRLAVGRRYGALKVWLDERVEIGVFVVRFLPGLRMPAYTTYGFFAMPFRRFLISVVLAVAIWTTGLFYLSYRFGALTEHWLGFWRWPTVIIAAMVPLLVARHLIRSRGPMAGDDADGEDD